MMDTPGKARENFSDINRFHRFRQDDLPKMPARSRRPTTPGLYSSFLELVNQFQNNMIEGRLCPPFFPAAQKGHCIQNFVYNGFSGVYRSIVLNKNLSGGRAMADKVGVVLLVGAGDAIGAAVARRFAEGGYKVCIARRDAAKSQKLVDELTAEGRDVHAFSVDARQESEVQNLFARVEETIGPIEVCLFNAGSNVNKPLLETTEKLFFKAWELACYAGFLVGREAARYMLKRGHGTILFTGATASVRGSKGFAAFSSAKFALRAVAQAMARELGPRNIHVVHLLIDAGVDSEAIHQRMKAATGIDAKEIPPDSLTKTRSIADAYWFAHHQARDGWTHELDLRPSVEKW
jgi:NAD(P)-dependent dehydrogenase (short-subunit alcohol dehydrogenase family)